MCFIPVLFLHHLPPYYKNTDMSNYSLIDLKFQWRKKEKGEGGRSWKWKGKDDNTSVPMSWEVKGRKDPTFWLGLCGYCCVVILIKLLLLVYYLVAISLLFRLLHLLLFLL